MFEGFSTKRIKTDHNEIFVRSAGDGPPLLLLHGFPETHLMWWRVAPLLVDSFTVVCADLRGYGDSGCPHSAPDHFPYSKRAMALEMVQVMEHLGFRRFAVAGHDRGARVAYRMALDHRDRIDRLAVLDVVPIEIAWARADADFALGYWPFSLLAQPEPLPERILTLAADAIVGNALNSWGSPATAFPAEVRSAYERILRDPGHAHAICEEYRAAATIDREHDREDQNRRHRIACATLVLWSAEGALADWYTEEGGPIGLWQDWCEQKVYGHAIRGGHFFAEEAAEITADMLRRFFGGS